jgi:hypothetical protein
VLIIVPGPPAIAVAEAVDKFAIVAAAVLSSSK